MTTFPLRAHGGSVFKIYRARDPKLAAEAARIARRWATGVMHYRFPSHLPFRSSKLGPFARAELLRFAKSAEREGGPEGVSRMFCSQFAGAVYQAALVLPQLASNPKLRAHQLALPEGLRFHASNVSPMTLLGHVLGSRVFRSMGEIVLDMAFDAALLRNPGKQSPGDQ